MAQRSCCVPGCSMKLGGGLPLHRFPNPNNPAEIERFRTWVIKIGGAIIGEDIFPNMKISALAIPTLEIPENRIRKRLRNLRATTASLTRRTPPPANVVPDSEIGLQFHPISITQSPNENDFSPSPPLQNTEDSNKSDQPRVSLAMSTSKRHKKSRNGKILDTPQRNPIDADNENLLFFKSLLPQVNKIPQHMLPSFRKRIQSVVEEFA